MPGVRGADGQGDRRRVRQVGERRLARHPRLDQGGGQFAVVEQIGRGEHRGVDRRLQRLARGQVVHQRVVHVADQHAVGHAQHLGGDQALLRQEVEGVVAEQQVGGAVGERPRGGGVEADQRGRGRDPVPGEPQLREHQVTADHLARMPGERAQVVAGAAGQFQHPAGGAPVGLRQGEAGQEGRVRPAMGEIGADRAERQQVHGLAEAQRVALRTMRRAPRPRRRGAGPAILVAQQQHERALRCRRNPGATGRRPPGPAVGAEEGDAVDHRPALALGGQGVAGQGQRAAGDRAAEVHGSPASASTAWWKAWIGPACTSSRSSSAWDVVKAATRSYCRICSTRSITSAALKARPSGVSASPIVASAARRWRDRRRQGRQLAVEQAAHQRSQLVAEQDLAGEPAIGQHGVVQVVRHAGDEHGGRIGAVMAGQHGAEHGHDQAVVAVVLRRFQHQARLARAGGAGAGLADQRLGERRARARAARPAEAGAQAGAQAGATGRRPRRSCGRGSRAGSATPACSSTARSMPPRRAAASASAVMDSATARGPRPPPAVPRQRGTPGPPGCRGMRRPGCASGRRVRPPAG